MAWNDQKPFTVDAEFVAVFERVKKPPLCFFCGKQLKLGDEACWVFTNNAECADIAGNPFIHAHDCNEHGAVPGGDGPVLFERMKAHAGVAKEVLKRYAWFLTPIVNKAIQEEMNEQARAEKRYGGW